MLALDSHAHIKPDIASQELERLNACVVAVTRTPAEYRKVAGRKNRNIIWALGLHPGVRLAHERFSRKSFYEALQDACIVGEIGLDRKSKVQMDVQSSTLDDILSCLTACPRIASLHTNGAEALALDLIERHDACGTALL